MDGRVLATGYERYPTRYLQPLGAEQDPEEMWRAVGVAARTALEASWVQPKEIIEESKDTPWGGRIAVFSEPDGNALQLTQINWGKYFFRQCISVRSSLPSIVLAKNRIVIEKALLFAGGFCNDPPRYYA